MSLADEVEFKRKRSSTCCLSCRRRVRQTLDTTDYGDVIVNSFLKSAPFIIENRGAIARRLAEEKAGETDIE